MEGLKLNSEEVIDMSRNWKVTRTAALTVGLLLAAVAGAEALPGTEVRELIESLEVGEAFYYENLTIVPIYADRAEDRTPYATLDEALRAHWLEVTEVEGGRVPQVSMSNRSSRCVFVMGGEILTGCRQDRIVGRDVLLSPGAKNVIVPVYCVEQGRWTYESHTFHSKENLGTAELRAEGQKADHDAQSKIWDYVSELTGRMGAASPTTRFQEAYESDAVRRKISTVEKTLNDVPRLWPDARGVVVGVGDRIISADIFVNPHVFKRIWPKLLRSSALAVVCDPAYGTLSQADAIGFLRRIHDQTYVRRPAVDLGFELSATGREVNVNGLVYGDSVIHLAGFPEDSSSPRGASSDDSDRRIPVMRR
jgi:hypothetical protein